MAEWKEAMGKVAEFLYKSKFNIQYAPPENEDSKGVLDARVSDEDGEFSLNIKRRIRGKDNKNVSEPVDQST